MSTAVLVHRSRAKYELWRARYPPAPSARAPVQRPQPRPRRAAARAPSRRRPSRRPPRCPPRRRERAPARREMRRRPRAAESPGRAAEVVVRAERRRVARHSNTARGHSPRPALARSFLSPPLPSPLPPPLPRPARLSPAPARAPARSKGGVRGTAGAAQVVLVPPRGPSHMQALYAWTVSTYTLSMGWPQSTPVRFRLTGCNPARRRFLRRRRRGTQRPETGSTPRARGFGFGFASPGLRVGGAVGGEFEINGSALARMRARVCAAGGGRW